MPADTAGLLEAVEAGRYLDAWALAEPRGPLQSWSGPRDEVLAGRLAYALGAARLGSAIHLRCRRHRPDAEARYYFARALLSCRGPWPAWRFLMAEGEPAHASAEVHGDWLALVATVAGRLRDFETAENYLARAKDVAAGRPWVLIEESDLLEQQDRHQDALAVARRTLAARFYRPGVAQVAHLLLKLGREAEALELLREGAARLQAASLLGQLALVQADLEQHQDALASLDRFESHSPLLEADGRAWLAARRSDAWYGLGDLPRAREHAERAGPGFHAEIARRLAQAQEPARRVRLEVPFVQQHHLTCSPASMSAVLAFWGRPADQASIAREIAYDGTPGWRQRQWLAAQGLHTVEFRLTWDAARALLDRGLAFTLVTRAVATAHEQTVAGYDALRGTLIIRDPGAPYLNEMLAEPMIEAQRAAGPRALVLVPQAERGRLDGLDLPDAGLYDRRLALELRLAEHDRAGAERELDALRAAAPSPPGGTAGTDHDLVLHARDRLAEYDEDPAAALEVFEALRARYPDTDWVEMRRVGALRSAGRSREAGSALTALAARRFADGLFLQRHAQDLLADSRRLGEAERWLARALRRLPAEAAVMSTLGRLRFNQRRLEEALDLYRFAACLEITFEPYVRLYFDLALGLGRAEEALRLLRDRSRRFAAQSGQPARSLFQALDDLHRTGEAFATLEEGRASRPDDAPLRLFSAEAHARHGQFEAAEALIAPDAGRARAADVARTRAALARYRGDWARAAEHWREVVAADPLDVDAQGELCRLLRSTGGLPAVLEHLAAATARFPHHQGLLRLHVSWIREESAAAAESLLGRLLEAYPDDAWSRRELALVLVEQGRFDEAVTESSRALAVEPWSPSSHGVLGHCLLRAGRGDEARAPLLAAVELEADYVAASNDLLDTSRSAAERRELLARVQACIEKEAVVGPALTALRRQARGVLEPDELLGWLRSFHAARPDLWPAWAALAAECSTAGRPDEGVALLEEAGRRFTLVPELRVDRATIHSAAGDAAAERQALEEALALRPADGSIVRRLADRLEEAGEVPRARALLESLLASDPTESQNHGFLADLLWRQGERERALDHIRRAVACRPGYDWAWDRLREWAAAAERGGLAIETARRLVADRPGDAQAWRALARLLDRPQDLDERLAALSEAARREPRNLEVMDERAEALARAGRFDEALAACRPEWPGPLPLELRGRAAWIEARRGRQGAALAAMQRLLEEDPTYVWGTRCLVEWLREHGTPAAYRQAAEHLAKLAPGDARSFGYRGEARERAGEREEAAADYERALALDARYDFACDHLLHLLAEAGHFDRAREVVARLAPGLGAGEAAARRLQVAAHAGRLGEAEAEAVALLTAAPEEGWIVRDAARTLLAADGGEERLLSALLAALPGLRRDAGRPLLQAACEREGAFPSRLLGLLGESGPVWLEAAAAFLDARSGDEGAEAVARELTARAPDSAAHWVLLAGALDAPGEREARLAALDRALGLEPTHLEANDMRVYTLAAAGRHDEARAACAPAAFAGAVPLELRGRDAWLDAQQQRWAEATRKMAALLAESPGYRWGADRLLEWHWEGKHDASGYLEAARLMVELSPGRADSHGYLGQALIRSGQAGEGEAAWMRALELDPAYEFASLSLLDRYLEGGRLGDAESLARHVPPTPAVRARRVELALAQDDVNTARGELRSLLGDDGLSRDHLTRAVDAFKRVRDYRWRDGEQMLADLALGRDGTPLLSAFYVERLAGRGAFWRAFRALPRLKRWPERQGAALKAFLDATGTPRRRIWTSLCLFSHRDAVAASTAPWAAAVYALVSHGHYRRAADLSRDWKIRLEVRPWMLGNVVLALRARGRDVDARAVSRHALALDADDTSEQHRVWLALDAALGASPDNVTREAHAIAGNGLSEWYRALLELARAAAGARSSAARAGRAGSDEFAEARHRLAEARRLAPGYRTDRVLRRYYRRVVKQVAEARGTLTGWLWFVFQW